MSEEKYRKIIEELKSKSGDLQGLIESVCDDDINDNCDAKIVNSKKELFYLYILDKKIELNNEKYCIEVEKNDKNTILTFTTTLMTMIVSFMAGAVSTTFIFKGNIEGYIFGYILFFIGFVLVTFAIFGLILFRPILKDSKKIVKINNEINRLDMIEYMHKNINEYKSNVKE